GRSQILYRRSQRSWNRKTPRARSMAQQPSRELPSADPAARAEDAGFQESGLSPEISLNARSRIQYLQRPAPSDFSKNASSLSGGGDECVARGSCCRLKMFEASNSRALLSTM